MQERYPNGGDKGARVVDKNLIPFFALGGGYEGFDDEVCLIPLRQEIVLCNRAFAIQNTSKYINPTFTLNRRLSPSYRGQVKSEEEVVHTSKSICEFIFHMENWKRKASDIKLRYVHAIENDGTWWRTVVVE